MARQKNRTPDSGESLEALQLPPAERRFAAELDALRASDRQPKPSGWLLSPAAVVTFVCGSDGEKIGATRSKAIPITRKFVGSRDQVQRCVVTLAGERGLMLVGEPGTAKSMLGELLAVAVSGSSMLTIQGTAGTTEDQIRYGWNYAMLLDRGPRPEALVPSPVMKAMREGRVVRFEEVTRCLPEVQDALISLLSERMMMVPELEGDASSVFAAPGFNLIATANLRDRGVSEMSAALKRRFNFETINPIADKAAECALVTERARAALERQFVTDDIDRVLVDTLVTVFRDLRNGVTEEGWQINRPSTVMSTAEAVSVTTAVLREALFFPTDVDPVSRLPGHLLGVALKDDAKDLERLLNYWDGPVARRARDGQDVWQRLADLRSVLDSPV